MRMRKMKNLLPRMEACGDYRIAEPQAKKGNWRSLKEDAAALWVLTDGTQHKTPRLDDFLKK